MQLPSDIAYGFVRWQALLAVAEVVGDTPPAEGDVPKALPASCTVRFTPVVTMLTSTAAGNATIVPQYIEGTIDPTTGLLVDALGNTGVWLVTGQYKVTFIFTSPAVSLPAITIDVAETHTPAAPRDLALSMTLTPTPATVFVVNQQVYNDTLAASAAASASATAAATSASSAATTAAAVPKWWAGTQTAYNALGAYDAGTLYLITGP